MTLKNILLVFSESIFDRDEVQQWLEMIKKEFRIWFHGRDLEYIEQLNGFMIHEGIRKEDTLVISDDAALLRRAQQLQVAVLACEGEGEKYDGFRMVVQNIWETESEFLVRCFQREHHLPWDILQTQRLLVREETIEDIDRIYAMYEQEHIIKYLEPPYPEREREIEYMKKYRKYVYEFYEYGLWHVIEKETGRSVGRAGLNPKNYEDDVAGVELGYMIVEPFLKKGYCMEVCQAIIEYAKTVLELEQLYCLIRPDNEVSVHIAEKLGFLFEKRLQDNGRWMLRYRLEL